jgi:hypothetical protein
MYNGPRYGHGGWNGWVNHQAIDSSRSDGLTDHEWNMINSGSSPGGPGQGQLPPEADVDYIICDDGANAGLWAFFTFGEKIGFIKMTWSVLLRVVEMLSILVETTSITSFLVSRKRALSISITTRLTPTAETYFR